MPKNMLTVVLADPLLLIVNAVRAELKQSPDIEVVGSTQRGRELITLVEALDPDVAVAGYHTNDIEGPAVLVALRDSRTELIFLTGEADPAIILACMLNGAAGYMLKEGADENLDAFIHKAALGGPVMCSRSLALMISAMRTMAAEIDNNNMLSSREREILTLIGTGISQITIARELVISPHTVKNHLTKIYHKLGVSGATQAINEAHRRKLI